MKILLVDDEKYILEYLTHIIDWQKYGFGTVDRSSNSVLAKELLLDNHYDLLITDIRMPEVTGLDLLRYIKEKQLATAVFFLSGYSEFEYAQKGIRYGLGDYLLKPVSKVNLEETLTRYLSGPVFKKMQQIQIAQEAKGVTTNPNDKVIDHLQSYICDHLEESLNLKQLAETVYLNPSYLSTLFKKETGLTISQFIAGKRMSKAQELLLNSQLRIVDISKMVGYKKPQYFDMLFKERFGLTPQQFRRENIGVSK